MDYLNDHQPTLVHGSPLPWSIYLSKENDRWRVTKLTALGVQWWDSAVDIGYLCYLPFSHVSPELWQAFLSGYGPAPDQKRILLHTLTIRFMAAMGAFVEPKTERNKAWAEACLLDRDPFMDDIEKDA